MRSSERRATDRGHGAKFKSEGHDKRGKTELNNAEDVVSFSLVCRRGGGMQKLIREHKIHEALFILCAYSR